MREAAQAATVSELWRKAAVVGGLWAAVEIIVGSFLHNLRIPLAGTALSCFGAALLVASHRRWPEKGLLWRAGLVCAVMKSVSPSAVILGPMIGIFMESLLLEAGVRLFLGSWAGYVVGAAAAVSWPLVQKAANLLITFGFDIVKLYLRLYDFAAARLQIDSLGPFNLILVLLGAQALLGAAAGIIGLEVGRRAAAGAQQELIPSTRSVPLPSYLRDGTPGKYSAALLALNLLGIVIGLLLLDRAPLWISAAFVALYVAAAARRYAGSLRRLRRPVLWIQLVLIMMLSGFLLGSLSQSSTWSLQGLLVGFRMSLRATLIIVGFSIMGVELRNPELLRRLGRRRLRNLIRAVETAFEALPTLSAALAEQRTFRRNPLDAAAGLIGRLDSWLRLTERLESAGPRFFFITGDLHEGKTTLAGQVVEALQARGFRVAGLLAPGIWKDGLREGFDAMNVSTRAAVPLCRRGAPEEGARVGPYRFFAEGIAFGREALSLESVRSADLAVVDEVGPLELRGEGWAMAVDVLRHNSAVPLLLLVRSGLMGEVIDRWDLQDCKVFRVAGADAGEIAAAIAKAIQGRQSQVRPGDP